MIFPIATVKGGSSLAFADPCLTAAGPVLVVMPYSNLASMKLANVGTCSTKVLVENQPVITEKSEIPTSSGNEAAKGGLTSGTIKGPAKFKSVSKKVKVEGAGVAYHTCPVGQNGASPNTVGVHCQPSQTKVKVNG